VHVTGALKGELGGRGGKRHNHFRLNWEGSNKQQREGKVGKDIWIISTLPGDHLLDTGDTKKGSF